MNDLNKLTDGLDVEQRATLGDLSDVAATLLAYDVPEPDTDALIQRLRPVLATQQKPAQRVSGVRIWLRLAQSQLSLLDSRFWWASGLLLALGTLVSVMHQGAGAMLFVVLSPLLTVSGVAYIFRPSARSLREMELFSAVSPLELLYARLILLLLHNAALMTVLVLVVWSQGAQLALGRLALIWFGPMLGLTGLALYVTVRWNSVAGMIVPLGLWCAFIFSEWRGALARALSTMPLWAAFTETVLTSHFALGVSLFSLLAGLWMIWRAGELVREEFAV